MTNPDLTKLKWVRYKDRKPTEEDTSENGLYYVSDFPDKVFYVTVTPNLWTYYLRHASLLNDLPIESPIAKGHNPDKLTEEQVGVADGWRLLEENEIWWKGCSRRRFKAV